MKNPDYPNWENLCIQTHHRRKNNLWLKRKERRPGLLIIIIILKCFFLAAFRFHTIDPIMAVSFSAIKDFFSISWPRWETINSKMIYKLEIIYSGRSPAWPAKLPVQNLLCRHAVWAVIFYIEVEILFIQNSACVDRRKRGFAFFVQRLKSG